MCSLRLSRVALFIIASVTTNLHAQEHADSALCVAGMPAEVALAMQRQQNAWNEADLVSFMKGYHQSDALMFVGKSGVTYGHEATLQRYQVGYPNAAAMGHLSFKNLKWIQIGPDAGWLLGTWRLEKQDREDDEGMYTLLWRRLDGVWLIVADHSS